MLSGKALNSLGKVGESIENDENILSGLSQRTWKASRALLHDTSIPR